MYSVLYQQLKILRVNLSSTSVIGKSFKMHHILFQIRSWWNGSICYMIYQDNSDFEDSILMYFWQFQVHMCVQNCKSYRQNSLWHTVSNLKLEILSNMFNLCETALEPAILHFNCISEKRWFIRHKSLADIVHFILFLLWLFSPTLYPTIIAKEYRIKPFRNGEE